MKTIKALPWLVMALIVPAGADARGICWLDKVTKVPDGLEVHFMSNSHVTIYQKGNVLEAPVVLTKGQSILVMGAVPEDSCSIEFAEKDGLVGVMAHAASNTGPAGHVVTEIFYPAE